MWVVLFIGMQTVTSFMLRVTKLSMLDKPWYARPSFILPWFVISMPVVVLGSVALGSHAGQITIFVPGLIALNCISYGKLLYNMIAESGGGLYGVGTHGDKPAKSSVTAISLVMQERYDEANEAFLQEIGDEPHGPLPENAPIRLEYGKFLRDRGKHARAITEWETAIQGDLDASQCAEAALSAADLLQNQMKDYNRSLRILRAAINRYPNANGMEALRRRLRQAPRPE